MSTRIAEQTAAYESTMQEFRRRREQDLLGDQSWFTLAGLFWLKPGENRFGSASDNDIVLAAHSAPDYAGVFHYDGAQVIVEGLPGALIASAGAPVTRMALRPRGKTPPHPEGSRITLGDLTMLVLQSGSRHAIRLYDRQYPARQSFTGLRWYSVDPAYRVQATFTPYPAPQTLAIVNITGDPETGISPGAVSFTLHGQSYQFIAEARKESLFFNFRDRTNGKTTYGGGRFLYAGLPDKGLEQPGTLTLDFNLATTPYCGYTPYAVCPLPPAENTLPIAVEAGEMAYSDTH